MLAVTHSASPVQAMFRIPIASNADRIPPGPYGLLLIARDFFTLWTDAGHERQGLRIVAEHIHAHMGGETDLAGPRIQLV